MSIPSTTAKWTTLSFQEFGNKEAEDRVMEYAEWEDVLVWFQGKKRAASLRTLWRRKRIEMPEQCDIKCLITGQSGSVWM